MTRRPKNIILWLQTAGEELRNAVEALKREDEVESVWIRSIAHSLNNQLNITLHLVELMETDLDKMGDHQVLARLHEVQEVNERMTETVRQFLISTRTADQVLKRQPVDVRVKLHSVELHFERQAKRKNITVQLDAPIDLPKVMTSRLALLEILENLLSNAIKFSPLGTTVTLKVWEHLGEVICSVTDQGPGLTEEDQRQLFQLGERLSAKPTGGEMSTGFGLAVSKRLADFIGARLWCESKPGNGATFLLALPIEAQPEPGDCAETEARTSLAAEV